MGCLTTFGLIPYLFQRHTGEKLRQSDFFMVIFDGAFINILQTYGHTSEISGADRVVTRIFAVSFWEVLRQRTC